ncbi:dysbindin-A isoform X4 [Pygocentrus nattereri]|uniref:dysbindin-A isoform X4 n=1 Tax=Pygocentrus nattereri TaxID=42514 RepID=UPI0008147A81|nr:dysbindin-A isoform X4 [Pygocentrus nattereri]
MVHSKLASPRYSCAFSTVSLSRQCLRIGQRREEKRCLRLCGLQPNCTGALNVGKHAGLTVPLPNPSPRSLICRLRCPLIFIRERSMSSPGTLDSSKENLSELDSEHSQKVLEMEHAQQAKLKERQKYFEEAFQQDMEQYLSTGYLQITDRRDTTGSMSSMEVNVDMLEQMDLTDVSDHEALDVFLNSGGEDNAVSPTAAPEAGSSPAEISLKVPSQTELQQNISSLSSSCTDTFSGVTEGPDEEEDASEESGGGDSPVVQSDEEEVQADMALAGLPEAEERLKNSDDSDTQTP